MSDVLDVPSPDDESKDMWASFRAQIDARLDASRPQRCSATEREWREPIYAWARNHMPDETQLVRRIAQREVDSREGIATKRGNIFIRDYMHGRVPLSWSLVGPLPVRVGKLRIRLDVATPKEVEDAARELVAAGQAILDEVALLAEGLTELAEEARAKGFLTVALIGDKPPKLQQEAG